MLERVFQILETTPTKLMTEVGPLLPAECRMRPRENVWSIVEIVAHLDEAEEFALRSRIAAIVEKDKPVLPSFDQNRRALEQDYINKNVGSILASFGRQRSDNVAWLKTLSAGQLRRVGTHSEVGEISATELVHEWAFHDLGHLRQILELKRYALYPHIGNMQKYYTLQWG